MRGVRTDFVVLVVAALFFSILSIRFSTTIVIVDVEVDTAPMIARISTRSTEHTNGFISKSVPRTKTHNLDQPWSETINASSHGSKATEDAEAGRETANTVNHQTFSRDSPPRPHPHAGARYPNGSWGYVADVTLVRRWLLQQYRNSTNSSVVAEPPISYLPIEPGEEWEKVCNAKPREGSERKAGWRLLTRKVVVNGPDPTPHDHSSSTTVRQPLQNTTNQQTPGRKILCAIYTHEKKHRNVRAIGETWGWRCDGFFAASTKTVDETNIREHNFDGLGAIDLPHEGPEFYENMWMKTRSIWAYIHDHYLDEFDYFLLSGDDTHVIVENLRQVLESIEHVANEVPLYLGQWIPDNHGTYFCGGGPGYVLNRLSLRLLVQNAFPNCFPHERTSAEDRLVGECFQTLGIMGNNSVDALGAQRFHGTDPHFVSHFKGEKGFYGMVYNYWGRLFGYKIGFNLTSRQSVSFHLLKKPFWVKRHHAILYKSCPKGTVLGNSLLGDAS